MSLDADLMVDRRRLKRRLSMWRIAAIALVVVVAAAAGARMWGGAGLFVADRHIARITIDGVISDDRKQQDLFDQVVATDSVQAVILHVNSPGGTTAGSEALYAAIRRAATKKPVVAVLGTVAASGGYVAALGSDYIVARGNTITGSIGVIFQWAEFTELFKTLGVKMEEVKSAPLKGQPSPFAKTTDEARAVTEAMIRDSYDWFVGLVDQRRPFGETRARELSDGRVYTGRQALEVQLIDAIGGERTALEWLREAKNIDTGLKVRDWSSNALEELSWGSFATVSLLRAFGLDDLANTLLLTRKTLRAETLSLDGLVSVWHPAN